MNDALLRFSIGPVQSYIASARTVRDLWTGSYLLSYLTARAAAEVINRGGKPLHPYLEDSPLVRLHLNKTKSPDEHLTRSCLPNLFFARFPANQGDSMREAVLKAVADEWEAIHSAVREKLHLHIVRERREWSGWDEGWERQLTNYWDVRVNWLEPLADWKATARALGLGKELLEKDGTLGHAELLNRAAAAEKLVRHYRPSADRRDTRPKCQQSGEDEQMFPIALLRERSEAQREYWEALEGEPIGGERLRKGERFGAPALVKRFAWPHYLAGRLGVDARALRNVDTSTIAAAGWIERARRDFGIPFHDQNLVEWARDRKNEADWSGLWLSKHPPKGEEPPPQVADAIRRAGQELGVAPPSYYAILLMDGDKIGERLKNCDAQQQADLARALHDFSLETVPKLIREYLGGDEKGVLKLNQPVYAGGDDVTALLPLSFPQKDGKERSVVDLALKIAEAFAKLQLPGSEEKPHMSAGLAIVHARENLREALAIAREAEKEAKHGGRNRLAIAACRRSGEHTIAVVRWENAKHVDDLIHAFRDPKSTDRWAYQLRAVIESLPNAAAIDVECARLLSRSEARREFDFHNAWQALKKNATQEEIDEHAVKNRLNALTLIQSASFMARGREEDR